MKTIKTASFLLLLLIGCNESRLENSEAFRFEEITIDQLQEGYANGDFTIKEVVQAYLDRIEKID